MSKRKNVCAVEQTRVATRGNNKAQTNESGDARIHVEETKRKKRSKVKLVITALNNGVMKEIMQ